MTTGQIKQLRGARAAAGLTQGELAEDSGVSASTVKNIEKGRASPTLETMASIEAALRMQGVSLERDRGDLLIRITTDESLRRCASCNELVQPGAAQEHEVDIGGHTRTVHLCDDCTPKHGSEA